MSNNSDTERKNLALLTDGKKGKKKEAAPIIGFSNLIKRDFHKRDGPKREPMPAIQLMDSKASNS